MNGPYPEITNISFLAKLFFKTFISLKHLSDYRTVELSDCRTIGLSDYSYGPVVTLGISTLLEYLKLYLLFFKTTKSFKPGGDSLYNILKHSNAIVRILLICRDGTFAICKSSSYVLL